MKILQPPDWMAPRGYSNGILAEMTVGSKLVFVGGQVGWNGQQQFESDDLADQVRQTLANIVAILAEGGAKPEHIVRMTWYVTSRTEYLARIAEIGAAYRELIGRNYPAMAVVEVAALVEAEAKVEIETIAVVPTA